MSQPLNDTTVLVKVPGAGNVKVENQTGVRTDWSGYAVLLADNLDVDDAVVSMVPTCGTIARVDFKATVCVKLLMVFTCNGKLVSFGAMSTSTSNLNGSIVVSTGQVYLPGMPPAGSVQVKWARTRTPSAWPLSAVCR